MINHRKERVLVAMSGGVDSSLSASLLKEVGHDVHGAFIRVWQPPFATCGAQTDLLYAMEVAAELDIPFEVIDLEDVYRRTIVDYMIDEYRRGRTPNPDVVCNRTIKFGAFLDSARARGFDTVATGHYAQVRPSANGDLYELHKGCDPEKDQTYFLWQLGQEELAQARFPIGHLHKQDVRALARERRLYSANRPDSQGLCFIGKLDMKEFLKQFIEDRPGKVLDTHGDAIGTHDGAWFLTLGQRRGFTVTRKTPNDPPLYVVAKDVEANTITVAPHGPPEHPYRSRRFALSSVNWLGAPPQSGQGCAGRTRYRQELISAQLESNRQGDRWYVTFSAPQLASPGQSAVFYDNTRCIGGGIIETPEA